MDYVHYDPNVHGLSNSDKKQVHTYMAKMMFGEESNLDDSKIGDMTFFPTFRYLLDKFYYLDEEYLLWDWSAGREWLPMIESITRDIVPPGAQSKGHEIYKDKSKEMWTKWMEEKELYKQQQEKNLKNKEN